MKSGDLRVRKSEDILMVDKSSVAHLITHVKSIILMNKYNLLKLNFLIFQILLLISQPIFVKYSKT